MEGFPSASALIGAAKPDRPVIGLRPHAAGSAARWFLHHFPGDVAYAYKANSSPFLLGALYGAGIRSFDVASIPEIEDAATIPGRQLHFMHPVKSRTAIRRAFAEFGMRSFALDSEDELKKIAEETGGVATSPVGSRGRAVAQQQHPARAQVRHQRRQGCAPAREGTAGRQELGITFHVGSQTSTPEAFTRTGRGRPADRAGRRGPGPARCRRRIPVDLRGDVAPVLLADFMRTIVEGVDRLPIGQRCRLMCEPGRALVAEAELLIVRVDARRGNELFINDGSYGTLFDATHMGFNFPVRLIGL